MDDDGSYGFINDNIEDYINLDVNGKTVTVFGLTNPRIYRYELPTNIPGLTFYPAVDTAMTMVPAIDAAEEPDLFVGLTHVGYQPYGGEVDSDELIAQSVGGLDVIIGGHSHTTAQSGGDGFRSGEQSRWHLGGSCPALCGLPGPGQRRLDRR